MQVLVADVAAQQSQGFQLRSLNSFACNGDGSGAADGAGQAALVGDVEFLCQTLAADFLKMLVLSGRIVFGGQQTTHLHGTDQTGGAYLGQLISSERMILQISKPLLTPGSGLFLVMDRDGFAAGNGDGF